MCCSLSSFLSLSLFFSFIMLCCQPRRQSKCLSTLRDLAIVMVESCRCCLGSRSGLVKLLAAHPFNCPSVRPSVLTSIYSARLSVSLSDENWNWQKFVTFCPHIKFSSPQLPSPERGAGAVEHSLLRNSAPAPATPSPTPSSPTSSASAWFFLFLFSAALFVLFYCCCCCCWSLLQFICMLKYVAFSLFSFLPCSSLIFFYFFHFFYFFFGSVCFFFAFLIWVNSARQMNFLRFAFVEENECDIEWDWDMYVMRDVFDGVRCGQWNN